MESWRKVWREGLAPLLTDPQLEVLLAGLRADDPALIQNQTTEPMAFDCGLKSRCEGGCLIAYPIWKGGVENVVNVAEAFERTVDRVDRACGLGMCSELLDWYDGSSRDIVIAEMLPEVQLEIEKRKGKVAA